MNLALVTVVLAQALDLTTFILMVARRSPAAEANPLVAHLLATVGVPGLLFGKAAIVVAPMAVAILAGLIGGYTNAVAYLG